MDTVNVVIYARFSSHAQNEQSIEGQLKVCYEYARRNNYTVVGEYIDRGMTGRNDQRPDFQRMLEDSKKKQFKYVLVYQLDRFARNRYDSAKNKAKLKKNGVRVLSARENISDDASGILMEAVLEGMAEYYSAELAQKVSRGMALCAEKCLYTGGPAPALGYKVNPDKTFAIDEDSAAVVQMIFRMYADGYTVKEITDYLNARKIVSSRGSAFNKNSLHHLLTNKRYIGIYTYKGKETPGGMPRIISDQLFYEVQEKMKEKAKAPARARAKEEFILTTRLFCGHCREMMIGASGTSKTGATHYYYVCKNAKQKKCDKKAVRKKYIEDLVVNKCRELLTEETIAMIANRCWEIYQEDKETSEIEILRKRLDSIEQAIESILCAIETGAPPEPLVERLRKKTEEKAEIEKIISSEELKNTTMPTEDQIIFFFHQLKKRKFDDLRSRKALIAAFVKAIYLYDDKLTLILTINGETIEISDPLLDEIEAATGSLLDSSGLPKKEHRQSPVFFFWYFRRKRNPQGFARAFMLSPADAFCIALCAF